MMNRFLKRKNSDKKETANHNPHVSFRTKSVDELTDEDKADIERIMQQIAQDSLVTDEALATMSLGTKKSLAGNYIETGGTHSMLDICNRLSKAFNDHVFSHESNEKELGGAILALRNYLRFCPLNDMKICSEGPTPRFLAKIIEHRLFIIRGMLNNDCQDTVQIQVSLGLVVDCITSLRLFAKYKVGVKAMIENSMTGLMIEALYVLNDCCERTNFLELVDVGRSDICLFLAIVISSHGYAAVIQAFDMASVLYEKPRFSCITNCFDSPKFFSSILTFINTILSNVGHEHDWQLRTLLRSEFFGLDRYILRYKEAVDNESFKNDSKNKEMKTHLKNYNKLLEDDEKMLLTFEKKIETLSWNECFDMLENYKEDVLGILRVLSLVGDAQHSRSRYLNYAEHVLRICLFGDRESLLELELKNGVEADHALFKYEDDSFVINILNKLRESSVAKEGFKAEILHYRKKVSEYKQEAELLRAYIADPKNNVMPPATICDVVLATSSSSANTVVTLVTDGPIPPSPAIGLLPAVKGGPPPPPGPPPNLKSGPPPPPPPPPPGLLKGGPIPPPPPPMNLGKIASSGVFLPPLPKYLKEKDQVIAEVPLKKLHWKSLIIPPIDIQEGSLWAKIEDKEVHHPVVINLIKENFTVQTIQKHKRCDSVESIVSTEKKTKKAVVLDNEKIQNAEIIFNSMKLSCFEWMRALMTVDKSILEAEKVEKILGVLPSSEILQKLAACSASDIEEMLDGEKYLVTFAKVKGIVPRLKAILLKLSWKERFEAVKIPAASISNAIDDLQKSTSLKTLLNLVLFIANYMNRRQPNLDDYYALKISVLKELPGVKAVDPNYSLLQAVVELMVKNFKGDQLYSEMYSTVNANKTDWPEIKNSYEVLVNDLKAVTLYVSNYQSQDTEDRFQEVMQEFISTVENDIGCLESMVQAIEQSWSDLQVYFALQKVEYPMKTLFADVVVFLNSYNEIVERLQKVAAVKKSKEKESTIPRKAYQTIEASKNETGSEGDPEDLYWRLQQGLYTQTSQIVSRSRIREPKMEKSLMKNNKEAYGYQVRRIGKPTIVYEPNGELPKLRPVADSACISSSNQVTSHRSPDENDDVPDAKTLIQQLKTL